MIQTTLRPAAAPRRSRKSTARPSCASHAAGGAPSLPAQNDEEGDEDEPPSTRRCATVVATSVTTALRCRPSVGCLLYTSDAADEDDSVDLGGRRIIKQK